MWWIDCFSLIVGVLYLFLILIFYNGWKRTSYFEFEEYDSLNPIFISVIVPCKNEEGNIIQLLESLNQQTYTNFEVIFIDDHSEDKTFIYINDQIVTKPSFHLINALGFGKKNALKEGILQSQGDLIVTTDADCSHPTDWLKTIVTFQNVHSCDLVICPVKIEHQNTFFSKLQELEFASLIASGAGSAGSEMPILCNGANLVFPKNVWIKNQDNLHSEEQSGDDMFLLENVKKKNGKIRFLKSKKAFVSTLGSDSLFGFYRQRRRWAAKSTSYSDWHIIFTACIVFGLNLFLLILGVLAFSNFHYALVLLTLFLSKFFLDTSFLLSVRSFFQLKKVWIYSLILSLIYPFYITVVALTALIVKPVRW